MRAGRFVFLSSREIGKIAIRWTMRSPEVFYRKESGNRVKREPRAQKMIMPQQVRPGGPRGLSPRNFPHPKIITTF